MNIVSIFEVQKESNKQIAIDECLNQYKLSARKHLELYIKLSSLADQTKCYEYWLDNSSQIEKDIVFSNYLDALGQILTLGLHCDYTDIEDVSVFPNDYCLSDQFLNLYIDINDLIISSSKDHYITLLEDFISLGITLGYSEHKIIDSFVSR
ncbi:MAG: dUTP diphosphatase [Clostridium sp.]